MSHPSIRPALVALLGTALWLSAAAPNHAQQPPSPDVTRQLLERLERLEKRNEELEKTLREQQEQLKHLGLEGKTAPVKVGQEPSTPEEKPAAPVASPDVGAVQKIVAEQLKAIEEKKKQDEEKKKQEVEAAWFEVGKDVKMTAAWRDSLFLETADKAFRFHVGGRVDFDPSWYSVDPALNTSIGRFNNYVDPFLGLQDGADFRRARLRFQGNMWEVFEFNSEVDFANFTDLRRRTLGVEPARASLYDYEPAPGVRITDAWMGVNQLPVVGTVRAGHQKEWITFTNATSGRFLTFLERPLLFDAFNNDFQFSDGVTVQNTIGEDRRAYAWMGFFRTNTNFGAFGVGDGEYAYDARFTCLPVWNESCRRWVHLGMDYSYRNPHYHQVRFRGRPQIFTGALFQTPNVANTGALFTEDGQQVVTLEYASAFGPLTLTSEWMCAYVPDVFTGGLPVGGVLPNGVVSRGNYFAHGYYVEALYFLTGEHRGYRREQPSYDRIRPRDNFFWVNGEEGWMFNRGAWELAGRYDYLDLSDGGVDGGILHAYTLGLNWHLNPNMKVQWNYVWTVRDFLEPDQVAKLPGGFSSFGMRFHWDF